MIYVIAQMEINDGCLDAAMAVFAKTVPQVLSEDGCIMYTPCADEKNANLITIVEAWKSHDALQAHLAAGHMAEFREAMKELRKGTDVRLVVPFM